MSERLTKQKIDKFTYAGGWDVRWDSDVTGLGVRLYPTGKKSFVLSYRLKTGSRPKRLTVLGPVGVITIDQARSLARLKLAEVIQGAIRLAIEGLLWLPVRLTTFLPTILSGMQNRTKNRGMRTIAVSICMCQRNG